MSAQRPLADLRVIDFGQYVAGPAAAMMLADFGAEVIHVDPLGGARWDSPAAVMLNRGKDCLTLDLKTAAGRSAARRLIASADAVIENFRPGVMNRLGLGVEDMRRVNPALVYLSLPGFSSRDNERAGLRAWEGVVAAACGQYSDMGLNRILMGIEPSFSPLPLASAYAAVLGAMAVTLALSKRMETGLGDGIEVPLAAALMEGLAYNSQGVEDYPERYKSNREKEIDRRLADGAAMDVSYEQLQALLDPFYRNFPCVDGRPLYVVSASHRDHPVRALKQLGLWEEMQAHGVPRHDPYLNSSEWPDGDGCTLASYPLSRSWADLISGRMKQVLSRRSAYDWERQLGDAGVPVSAQRTTQEWLASEHALQSGLVLPVEEPEFGTMRQIGNVAWLASDAATSTVKKAARPVRFEEIDLARRPACPQGRIGSKEKEGWLSGLKILDLTNVIAGPTIASTLVRFGAEVISVDPVQPTMDPWNSIIFGMHAGRGKRSLLMNIKSDDGRAATDRLLTWAAVVTVNATDKQLPGMGLHPERLQKEFPELILCQLDCFGGPLRGQRSDHPGYDDLAQAATGVMARFGGSLQTPEEHAHFGTIDVLGGFCAALSIGAALIRRRRTGKGDVARASLCAAGQLIQAPFMYDYEGRAPFDEPCGRSATGWGPLYRSYRARDGWFFLAADPGQVARLARVAGLEGAGRLEGPELETYLEKQFLQRSRRHWVASLGCADVGAHVLDKMYGVRDRHLLAESAGEPDLMEPTFAFIRHDNHPSGRWVDLVAPNAVRPMDAPIRIPGPMPAYGNHSRDILEELGLKQTVIDRMFDEGTVSEQWCETYLPT